ncbi:hypothetical protein K456DRAFT_1941779 [Colletotrichum gloeosporioides 23]|nr:hypothetical protein K456DRAFT_1941779 [Colletotrichum gloeosporioides 23]
MLFLLWLKDENASNSTPLLPLMEPQGNSRDTWFKYELTKPSILTLFRMTLNVLCMQPPSFEDELSPGLSPCNKSGLTTWSRNIAKK